jgi:hypothetical protein
MVIILYSEKSPKGRIQMDYTCKQTHVHEFQTTAEIEDEHFHRIAGVSGMALPTANSHVHELCGQTTFEDGHFHPFYIVSGPAVAVSADAHVHYAEGMTAMVDGHTHKVDLTTFQFEAE